MNALQYSKKNTKKMTMALGADKRRSSVGGRRSAVGGRFEAVLVCGRI
jgi:hypothetical protein